MSIKTKIALLVLTVLIGTLTGLSAREFQLENVMTWPEKANLMGSPSGFMYITQYKNVQVYASPSNRVLNKSIKRNEKIFTSPGGNFWLAAEFDDHSAMQYRVTGLSIYTPSGDKVYSIKNPDALKFILNDKSAHMVGIVGTEGLPETDLNFYNASGILSNTHRITNYLVGKFSEDGNLFFAHSADSGLYVFNPEGQLQYRLNSGRRFSVSNDGRMVLTSNGGHLTLYYQTSLTNSIRANTSNVREIIISDDNTRAIVMSEESATCYSIPDLKTLWIYKPSSSSEHLSSCDFNGESGKVSLGIAIDSGSDFPFSERYNTGKAVALDRDGNSILSADLSYSSWSKGFPEVKFSSDGKILWIISHYDLIKIALE